MAKGWQHNQEETSAFRQPNTFLILDYNSFKNCMHSDWKPRDWSKCKAKISPWEKLYLFQYVFKLKLHNTIAKMELLKGSQYPGLYSNVVTHERINSSCATCMVYISTQICQVYNTHTASIELQNYSSLLLFKKNGNCNQL